MYSVEQLPRCDVLRLSPMFGNPSCRLDETPLQITEREREIERERENSEIGARTKRRKMANRLKCRESISEAEHYFCKHCTTIYIGGYFDTYRKRKHNEKVIMNSTNITYEVMYSMCYLINFFFALRLKKFCFLPRQGKSESNMPLNLVSSQEEARRARVESLRLYKTRG